MIFQFFPMSQQGGQITSVMFMLQQWGLLDAILPFMLLFGLIFATLQKVKIFEKAKDTPDRKINGTLAFVIAALVVVPHITRSYPPQFDPIVIMLNILPQAGLLLLTLFIVLVMIGMVSKKPEESVSLFVGLAFLLLLGGVITLAIWPAFVPTWLWLDPNTMALIITLLIFAGIVWFIMRDESDPKDAEKSTTNTLRRAFGLDPIK